MSTRREHNFRNGGGLMSKTRRQEGYSCYTCSKAIIFQGSHIRYNLDGSLHLCSLDDRVAYGKYCEYLEQDKHAKWIGWRLCGIDFWRWRKSSYYESYVIKQQQQPTTKHELRRWTNLTIELGYGMGVPQKVVLK